MGEVFNHLTAELAALEGERITSAEIVDVIEPALIEAFIDQTLKNDLAVIKESK